MCCMRDTMPVNHTLWWHTVCIPALLLLLTDSIGYVKQIFRNINTGSMRRTVTGFCCIFVCCILYMISCRHWKKHKHGVSHHWGRQKNGLINFMTLTFAQWLLILCCPLCHHRISLKKVPDVDLMKYIWCVTFFWISLWVDWFINWKKYTMFGFSVVIVVVQSVNCKYVNKYLNNILCSGGFVWLLHLQITPAASFQWKVFCSGYVIFMVCFADDVFKNHDCFFFLVILEQVNIKPWC